RASRAGPYLLRRASRDRPPPCLRPRCASRGRTGRSDGWPSRPHRGERLAISGVYVTNAHRPSDAKVAPVRRRFPLLFWMLLFVVAVLSACDGCRPTSTTTPANGGEAAARPDLRLFFVSDLAGAIEPCGCVKDQLGGMDHFAALVDKEKAGAAASAVLAVGPTHFMDVAIPEERKNQEAKKAVAIAQSLEAA